MYSLGCVYKGTCRRDRHRSDKLVLLGAVLPDNHGPYPLKAVSVMANRYVEAMETHIYIGKVWAADKGWAAGPIAEYRMSQVL